MSYPRFFVDFDSVEGSSIVLDGESARHISRSLRMTVGEKIIVCDTKKNEYECVLESFSSESVTARVEDVRRCVSEPIYNAVVYQACPKSDKMDSIVQKAVELGAVGVVVFVSDRCIARYDESGFAKKCLRWQKIANEAAKQSGRGAVPFIRFLPDLKSAVNEMTDRGEAFMCYEDEDTLTLKEYLKQIESKTNISFLIGPEGGFSTKEAEYCREKGVQTVGLGKRVLRTETASGFVLASLAYEREL